MMTVAKDALCMDKDAAIKSVVAYVTALMAEDRKSTALKALQVRSFVRLCSSCIPRRASYLPHLFSLLLLQN